MITIVNVFNQFTSLCNCVPLKANINCHKELIPSMWFKQLVFSVDCLSVVILFKGEGFFFHGIKVNQIYSELLARWFLSMCWIFDSEQQVFTIIVLISYRINSRGSQRCGIIRLFSIFRTQLTSLINILFDIRKLWY